MTEACLLLPMETSSHSQLILFNLYIRYLSVQVLHSNLLQYADDSSLIYIKAVPSKDHTIVVDEMKTDELLVRSNVEY